MKTANEITTFAEAVDDVAARWTERILENLRAAGVRKVSIDMELETWRTLKKVLHAQILRQSARRAAFRPTRRTDFMPRPQLSAIAV
jgi:hypothetical protein